MYVNSIAENAKFDFIIVGAGSAGCVLANRLSENASHTVLLMEAGGPDNGLNFRIPLLVANAISDENVTWQYKTEPQVHLSAKPHTWVRGRVLGGSGSINGNMLVRGDPLEYDAWHELGCRGWSYAELLPYFKQLEDFPRGDARVRGRGGPISITRIDKFDELAQAFVAASAQNGFQEVYDYNDGSHYEGTSYPQLSTRRGLRSSSSVEYLRPAGKRKNLTVLTHATAARVLTKEKSAIGVEFQQRGGALAKAYAGHEVILSAGPLQSPKLLEHSGIGNESLLKKYGITPVHHLPGVGENLRDHASVRMTFECAKPITINDLLNSPAQKLKAVWDFIIKREGILTVSATTARTVLRSRPDLKQADLIFRLLARSGSDRYTKTKGGQFGGDQYSGFSIGLNPLQPRSAGTVHIESPDPFRQASMDPKYLSDENDARLLIEGLRIGRRIAGSPALKPLIVRETRPGADIEDDEGLLAYTRATAATCWHMVGTCKMGIDSMAVVDPRLCVHGMQNLRVIDSSICPTLPASNTNAATLVIAEKGAASILESLT